MQLVVRPGACSGTLSHVSFGSAHCSSEIKIRPSKEGIGHCDVIKPYF